MVEFIQNYGIWFLVAGAMFLMHRLGIGCCGGHRHGTVRGHCEARKVDPKPTDAKATEERRPEVAAPPRRGGGCH